jgi:hypothetical protein
MSPDDLLKSVYEICPKLTPFLELVVEMRETRGFRVEDIAYDMHYSRATMYRLFAGTKSWGEELLIVRHFAKVLQCNQVEETRLIQSFLCYVLKKGGFI